EVKELKNFDHSSALLATIRSEVPTAIKEYIGINLDAAFYKTALAEFDLKQALFDSMHASKSFNKTPTNKTIYHDLMESLIEDENTMDQGLADSIKQKKRPHDDADRDEGPTAGSD
nr:hypothetical protein [Tanacetum cinerariifolium]